MMNFVSALERLFDRFTGLGRLEQLEVHRDMGNLLCLNMRKSDVLVSGRSDSRACERSILPAAIWSPSHASRVVGDVASAGSGAGARSLLDTCVGAAARHFDQLPSEGLAALPSDLMQKVRVPVSGSYSPKLRSHRARLILSI